MYATVVVNTIKDKVLTVGGNVDHIHRRNGFYRATQLC